MTGGCWQCPGELVTAGSGRRLSPGLIVVVMKRSHRVALKPTAEQEVRFGQHAGYARFAYNWALGEFKAGLDVGEWLSERTLRPRWNRVKGMIAPWGTDLSQNAAKYAIIDLGQAAEAWGEYRRKVKAGQRPGRRVGFPRFKRRKHEQGFRADNGPDIVKVDGKIIMLPKIGRVAMVEELRFHGSIREVTINRTAGTWFASCCVEDGQEPTPVKDGPTIGVDVGVGTMATCSDGAMVDNPKALSPCAARSCRRLSTRPSPAAGTSTGRATIPTDASGSTPNGAGSMLGWSTFATTAITRRRRR